MWNKKITIKGFPNRSLVKKILAMVLITAVVCGIVALFLFRGAIHLDTLWRRLKYWNIKGETTSEYRYDAHNSNAYANADGGLAVASVAGLNIYGSDGRELLVSQAQMSLPQIQTGKDLIMAYDVGGTTLLAVDQRGREVLRVTAERPILDADLSNGGEICYVSSEPGYKSVLTVYNDKQERIYRWLSTSTFMPLCAISDKGKELAAIGLDEQDGTFVSTLNLFKTDRDQLQNTVVLGSDLIYDLMYRDEDLLCAIGESGITYLSAAGELLGTYSYDGNYLKDYDTGGDGFLALSLNTYRAGTRYTLTLVDDGGVELGSVYIGREILDISVAGKYIAVLTSEGLIIYDRSLVVCAQTEETKGATSVLMQPDGAAILLGASSGTIYVP